MRRTYSNVIKGVNTEAGTVSAILSSESPDREGDIIRVDGWDFSNFSRHPVLLADHNYKDINAQIGDWSDVKTVKARGTVEGTANYLINKGNQTADWAFALASRGQAAYSVGFIPDMSKAVVLDEGSDTFGPFEFKGQELLEVSAVTIPANPEALQRMKTMGLDLNPVVREMVETALEMDADGPSEIQTVVDELAAKIEKIEQKHTEKPEPNYPVVFDSEEIKSAIRRGVYRVLLNR